MKTLSNKSLFFVLFSLILLFNANLLAQTNVLTNGGNETGDASGWTITASGGSGWNYTWGVRTGSYGFATSYAWDIMEQTVDLVAAGYTGTQLDAQPDIIVSGYVLQRADYPGNGEYFFTFKLLESDGSTVVASYNIGTQGSPAIVNPKAAWNLQTYTFSSYGTGVRYIYFQFGGQDGSPNWANWFGPYFDDMSVIVEADDTDNAPFFGCNF